MITLTIEANTVDELVHELALHLTTLSDAAGFTVEKTQPTPPPAPVETPQVTREPVQTALEPPPLPVAAQQPAPPPPPAAAPVPDPAYDVATPVAAAGGPPPEPLT
ncbi:MAG TPA: hypothetical protein VG348_15780 [Acidimicrobiia bacterium]|jgi:hypothetical protein|nr:hypothetical protein [Acidimicrobiia bacterium]